MDPLWIRRLDRIKKGSKVGSTVWNHKIRPALAPWKAAWGKTSMRINKRMIHRVETIRFIVGFLRQPFTVFLLILFYGTG
jgi:hypothetical protein